ncbi:hypothetical protein POM88_017977 [Heracleum sosnowskyi]|uniref:Uncharacterized protein n=1 Tax=Heracleum sosnowskyi TaxID=360622 RepID=A0AAD8IPM6_9APIA|nr:hypothetical protein POM88_017977 [Heracleum sosnowskyi]
MMTSPCKGRLIFGHNTNERISSKQGEVGSMLSSETSSSALTGADALDFSGSVPNHPLSQMQPEVCLEPESTYARSEVGLIKFSDKNFPQLTIADEHLKDVRKILEGESVTSNYQSWNTEWKSAY